MANVHGKFWYLKLKFLTWYLLVFHKSPAIACLSFHMEKGKKGNKRKTTENRMKGKRKERKAEKK